MNKQVFDDRKKLIEIIVKSWTDEQVRHDLLNDPKALFEKNGISTADQKIRVIEADENELIIQIPKKITNYTWENYKESELIKDPNEFILSLPDILQQVAEPRPCTIPGGCSYLG